MKIKRKVLLDALKAVQPGLASKELLEQSQSFIFTDGFVVTYNDEVAVSYPIDIDLEGAVVAKDFFGLVNKIKADEFELTIKGNELLLKGSKAKSGLRLEKKITLPIDAVGVPEEWIDLPDLFCDGINFCLFSASKNEAHAALTCLHINGDFIESCDNHRITRFDMGEGAGLAFPTPLLVSASICKDIAASKPIEYGVTKGWLHFRNENEVTFSCRYYNNIDYPNFDEFLEVSGTPFTFPAELHEVMDRAKVMSNGERVTLILETKELIVTSENENGWFEESIECDCKCEPIEFDIQPEFMNSLLSFKGEITIGNGRLFFQNDEFIHVVKLLKPKERK